MQMLDVCQRDGSAEGVDMAETTDGSLDMIRVILARAATDAALRAQLVAGGASTLRALGVAVPDGVTVRFHEDSLTVRHFVIPSTQAAELTEADLDKVAGGARDQMGSPQQMNRPSMQQMGDQMGAQQMGRGPGFSGFGG
jgi:hypothetical protein